MTKPSAKITIPDVLDRFVDYFEKKGNGAWGSLHNVLEDQNIEDLHVRNCEKRAAERGDSEGLDLARILLQMSKTQRIRLGELAVKASRKRLVEREDRQ